MTEELFSQLEERGYKGRIVSIQHLDALQEEIEGHHRQGMFDEEFYQECLTGFAFSPPDSLLQVKSLIVVAIPQPQIQVVFTWEGERRPLFIPPTYVAYEETNRQVEDFLATSVTFLEWEAFIGLQPFTPTFLARKTTGRNYR
jgi:hypothetical protein